MSSNEGLITSLANYVGAPEPAFRLLISLLFGYPLAAIYHKYIINLSSNLIHSYFTLTGVLICIFNYGLDVYHSLAAISLTYGLCHVAYKSNYLAVTNFIAQMGYLLIGYYFTSSDNYDIKWTMPHCVLTLRLIGFGFDISDGRNSDDKLSKDQLQTALKKIPTFLELTGFAYFPASFLIGPQFPYRRYQKFIEKGFVQFSGNVETGLKRGGLGLLYLLIQQIGSSFVTDEYLQSTEFTNLSYWRKLFNVGLWGRLALYKYISCWLLTEGALMCFGLTYNGKNKETGEDDWYGCSNVKLKVFEMATKMDHYVQSFNVNTNHWVAQYVYKRLKFLNNRTISYASALLFLAVWHGFHSGYYVSFFLEYLIITFEKQFYGLYSKEILPNYSTFLNSLVGQILSFIVMKFYNTLCIGWCLVPFVLLTFDRYNPVCQTLYHYGYITIAMWFHGYFIYMKFLSKKRLNDNIKQPTEQKKE